MHKQHTATHGNTTKKFADQFRSFTQLLATVCKTKNAFKKQKSETTHQQTAREHKQKPRKKKKKKAKQQKKKMKNT